MSKATIVPTHSHRPMIPAVFLLIFLSLALTMCQVDEQRPGNDRSPNTPLPGAPAGGANEAGADIWQPAPGTSWQWQLSGEIDTTHDVDMVDIDLFDAPQEVIDELHGAGRVVICYFSAGSYEDWRPDAGDFPDAVLGHSLDDWPGERWLDASRLDLLAPIMAARLDMAVQKECDGVEPDNVDAYANDSGFPLTAGDQIAYNIWLSTEAHRRGLSIGLKNDLDQIPQLLPYFDWALNEQCFEYEECELLLPFVEAGKAVFGVEYTGDLADFCPPANAFDFDWLYKDIDLGPERSACR